ncbi:anionic trypsin-like [Oratosquilla oratoria]|uniref:anionic trypsin-like n=1 Tax=Oratosquilla oratoria TaxID=337810 RepID=UPI003F768B06
MQIRRNKLCNLERDEEPWASTLTPGEFIIQYFIQQGGDSCGKGIIRERPLFLRESHFPASTLPFCMHDAELNANNHSLSALALVDAETRVGAAAESFGAASTFKLALGASRRRHRGTLGPAEKCGQPSEFNRIVGGVEIAPPNSQPWLVLLILNYADGNSTFCGGSIIKKRWILTAAHCFPTGIANVQVLLGAHDASATFLPEDEPTVPISNVIIHESYNDTFYDNDIALVKLNQDITFSAKKIPICLAKAEDFVPGRQVVVSGWGDRVESDTVTHPKPFTTELNLTTTAECTSATNTYNIWTNNMICASAPNKDSCQGDSGGPLVVQKSTGFWLQLGIVSFGQGCARPNLPGVYTNLPKYEPWIAAKTGSNTC